MATPFGVEKLEWCGNQMVKKFRIRFDIIQERDRQTDGHRMTASRSKNHGRFSHASERLK